ncbi:hypothetical protein [Aquimarina intermedia]|uniref:hypothetical protein n=1 Tax=Aquimarina intermedia TaxID=350814 RepID=UPI0011E71EC8|nr:hypothetical protein [Aquimarina intermedia]
MAKVKEKNLLYGLTSSFVSSRKLQEGKKPFALLLQTTGRKKTICIAPANCSKKKNHLHCSCKLQQEKKPFALLLQTAARKKTVCIAPANCGRKKNRLHRSCKLRKEKTGWNHTMN